LESGARRCVDAFGGQQFGGVVEPALLVHDRIPIAALECVAHVRRVLLACLAFDDRTWFFAFAKPRW
jgi:hypothetical protein